MNPTRRERWPPIISSRFEYTFEKLWLLVTQKVWKPGSIRSSFWMVFKPWMENEKLDLVTETVYSHENQVTLSQTVALSTNDFCSEAVPRRMWNGVPDSGTWCPRFGDMMSPNRGHVPESGTSWSDTGWLLDAWSGRMKANRKTQDCARPPQNSTDSSKTKDIYYFNCCLSEI